MLAALIFLCTCESPEPAGPQDKPDPQPPVPQKVEVVSVSMSETSITLEEGDSHTLVATVLPSNADDPSVTWTSDDASVATVRDGVVTAVSVGSTKVTAKAGSKSAVCKVTVNEKIYKVESIGISESALSLMEGETFSLVATVLPDNATDPSVSWSVDKNGVIDYQADGASFSATAVKAGEVVVSVVINSDNSIKASCKVTVTEPPVPVTSVSLDRNEVSLETGGSIVLTATVLPTDATDASVVWSVDNPAVLELVADGASVTVNALSDGDATVTVTSVWDPSLTASCTFTVVRPASDIPVGQDGDVVYPEDDFGNFE